MSEPFIAEIKIFAGNFAPRGWAFCDGQLLPISSHSALFSLLGTTYGGDGRSTFALPDLRSRVAVHSGSGNPPGLTHVQLGRREGQESVVLNSTQLPSHTHAATATPDLTVGVSTATANADDPDGAVIGTGPNNFVSAAVDANMAAGTVAGSVAVSVGNTGNSQPVSVLQPLLGLNFIIALNGIYPSRN